MEYKNFNLPRPSYNVVPDEGPIYWLIHPGYNEYCDVLKWAKAVDHIANGKGTLIISQIFSTLPYELDTNGVIKKLKSEDRVFDGDWIVLLFNWKDIIDELKRKHHIVFGQMIDACELYHIKDLLSSSIPSEKIHLLTKYSFSRNSSERIGEALEFYKEKEIDIFDGEIEELVLQD